MRRSILATGLLTGIICTGCAGISASQFTSGRALLPARHSPVSSSPIQHVIIVLQENRSFDDFFATFPGADGTTYGCMEKGVHLPVRTAQPATSQCPTGDKVVQLVDGRLTSDSLGHQFFSYRKEYDDGRMDGFDRVERTESRGMKVLAGTYAYRYVDPKYIEPYWQLAEHWVLADHMFTTQGSSSFTAHQDFIAGGTPIGKDNVIDFPTPANWGCTAPPGTVTSLVTSKGKYLRDKGPFPCFTYETIRDLLDAKGISWLYFTNPSDSYVWNAFDAIKAVREGPEWSTNIIIPETQIFSYISNSELPAVSYVIPDSETSDHPNARTDKGPQWVASVVNAIGESSYWTSSVIIVTWDEWGGEYDNVPPPQLDGQGLGPRVALLIISPYDKETSSSQPGYISHTQYEDGSILKFMEENWNLGSLGTSDRRANSISDVFDFTQSPRAFVTVPSSLSIDYFAHRYKVSSDPIDEY